MNTILLIDDEVDFGFFVKANLEATKSFSVMTARTGPEGLHLARLHRPDLILLDVFMPEMSGGEVLEELERSPATASIPVILLTAMVTKAETGPDNFECLGGRYYMAKPVTTEVLLQGIQRVLSLEV